MRGGAETLVIWPKLFRRLVPYFGLGGTLAGGGIRQVRLGSELQPGNGGDTVLLLDPSGGTVDQVTYKGDKVRPGRPICFGS